MTALRVGSRAPLVLLALLPLAGLFLPATARAQIAPPRARVTGIVRAQSGRPVDGAEVRVEAKRTQTARDGVFALDIDVGRPIELVVTAAGFAELRTMVAPVAAGTVRDVPLVLSPLAQLAVTQVVAVQERPLLNASDATTGGALERIELRTLPTAARDPYTLAFNVPGVMQATGFFGDAPKLSFNGANALYTAYVVDGLDNREGFLGGPRVELPLAALERLDVLVNTYTSRLGRSPSGIVNLETRAGGSTWRGDVLANHRPGIPFDARAPFVPPGTAADDFRRAQQGFRRTQLGASAGGPLATDRTFAFVAIEGTDENEDRVQSTARATFLGREARRTGKGFARLDHGWSPSQTTTVRVAGSWVSRAGQGSGIVAPEADITTIRAGSLAGLTHRSSWLGGRASHEASVQLATFRWNFPPTNSSFATPQVTILDRDSLPVGVVGSSNFIFDESERQWQLRDVLEVALGDRHTVSVGADVATSRFWLTGASTNPAGAYEVIDNGDIPQVDGRYRFADIPAGVTVRSYTIDAAQKQVFLTQTTGGAFVEDRWRPTASLTIRAGLRWDVDDITGRGVSPLDLDNWQPRVSFNWANTSRSIVRGGAGRFVGVLPYAVYSDAVQFGPDGNQTVTFLGADAPAFLQGPRAPQLDRSTLPPREVRELFALGIESPESRQYTLGYQRQFGRSFVLGVDAVWVDGRNLPLSWDLNATTRRIGPADTVGLPLTIGDSFRPTAPVSGGFRRLTTTASAGRSTYRALYVAARYVPGPRLVVDANWTWARARTNTEDINFNATQGNDFEAEWADATNDRRHHVTLRTTWTPRDWEWAAVADWQTGTPVNRVAFFRDLNGSGAAFGDGFIGNYQRFAGVPRNGERLPAAFLVNASAARRLPLRGGDVLLRLEVFNLFNRVNVSGYANGIPGGGSRTQVGRPGDPIVFVAAGAPRQLQASLEWRF